MTETHFFESTGGASVELDDTTIKGQRLRDSHQNAQLEVSGLGGGKWGVDLRFVGGARWVNHITGASESDVVPIAGPSSPVFEALRVTFSNVPAQQVSKITLNTWVRRS